eukprot:Sro189_g081431.2  (285) ;mRNA; r:26448-27302
MLPPDAWLMAWYTQIQNSPSLAIYLLLAILWLEMKLLFVLSFLLPLVTANITGVNSPPPQDGNDYCCGFGGATCNPCLESCGVQCKTMEAFCTDLGYQRCNTGPGSSLNHQTYQYRCCDAVTNIPTVFWDGANCNIPNQSNYCSAHALREPQLDQNKPYCCWSENGRRALQQNNDPFGCAGSCDPNCHENHRCYNLDNFCWETWYSTGRIAVPCGNGCCDAQTGDPVNLVPGGTTSSTFQEMCDSRAATTCTPVRGGKSFGDPHFQKWSGEYYGMYLHAAVGRH